jgi:hypothetical protein
MYQPRTLPAWGIYLNEGGFDAGIFCRAIVPTSPPRIDRDLTESSLHAAEYWVIVPTVVRV